MHEIADASKPQARDIVVTKSKPSAFFGTPLASMLPYLVVDTLVVTGMVRAPSVSDIKALSRKFPPRDRCRAARGEIV